MPLIITFTNINNLRPVFIALCFYVSFVVVTEVRFIFPKNAKGAPREKITDKEQDIAFQTIDAHLQHHSKKNGGVIKVLDINITKTEQNIDSQTIYMDDESYTPALLTKSELVKIENKRAHDSDKKIFSHFYMHIPKAGGGYMFGRLMILSGYSNQAIKAMNKTHFQRPCYESDPELEMFEEKFKYAYKGIQCNMWIVERPISTSTNDHRPEHAYTIIRSPKEHIISQYHHCKESRDHKRWAYLMPSFDEWIDYNMELLSSVERASAKQDNKFRCYNPINLQSFYADFWENTTEKDLYQRFDIIGDMAQLEKSACAITIRYTGYVPLSCNCTDQNRTYQPRNTNITHVDHGVQHHGSSYNLTDDQSEKISQLTKLDELLYERAKNVFALQVKEIEEELHIVICDHIP